MGPRTFTHAILALALLTALSSACGPSSPGSGAAGSGAAAPATGTAGVGTGGAGGAGEGSAGAGVGTGGVNGCNPAAGPGQSCTQACDCDVTLCPTYPLFEEVTCVDWGMGNGPTCTCMCKEGEDASCSSNCCHVDPGGTYFACAKSYLCP